MILKDDTVMEIINNYLAIELPKTDSSSAAAAPTGG